MAENQAASNTTETAQPVFGIEKIYIKDMSLEVPNAPEVFLQREAPQIGVELSNAAKKLEDGLFEVTLTVTVTSKIEDKTVFLVEVAQSGIFQVRNISDESIEPIIAITCPNILFPYAREAVSDIVTRAGFQPVLLSPINFEALYAQQKEQPENAGNATSH